jgi:phosphoribosylcarboxyaminoimidazole (NCAIR) mutase
MEVSIIAGSTSDLDTFPLNVKDALYSILQMPKGVPVATMAIGKPGVINAIVYAAKIIALQDSDMKARLTEFKAKGSKL